jgi:flavin reductase (DIM6/NTAB) family NADH-FMN oxidoreductase RutF
MSTEREFDELVSKLNPPMVVVTTVAGDQRAGCLAGFHTQCSVDPPRYALWLSKANHTMALALYAKHFGIHFLGAGDHDLAVRFGTRCSDEVDKFEGLELDEGPEGLPLLRGEHRIVGHKHGMHDDGGDHVCVVIEADAVEMHGVVDQLHLQEVIHLKPGHGLYDRRGAHADGGLLEAGG